MEKLTELFEQARVAQAQDPPQKLAPDRHPNRDFFVADILDWALKDDRASMEHPMFSLAKTPDRKIRYYEHNGKRITVAPGAYGLATIWDKDVLIYAVSQLVEAINQGRSVSRTVRLKAYDLLVATNRHTGGDSYERLIGRFDGSKAPALKRISSPTVNANAAVSDSWKNGALWKRTRPVVVWSRSRSRCRSGSIGPC